MSIDVGFPTGYIQGMIKNIQKDREGRVVSGTCYCGSKVALGQFTCECDRCGKLYNWCGQELRDPSEWEEDY